ncbi:MAG: hypothetical protein PHF86_07230 [Candidatus Nanoarchaeia archaeon]|jgi:hypothetical protein|nr:hypothetical protein [Candidatus Nanoarchaeia archaeon]
MNSKLKFLTGYNSELKPEEEFLQKHFDYSDIVKISDTHYNLKGKLLSIWQSFLVDEEFKLIEDIEENKHPFKIKSKTDRIIIVELDNKQIALNITTLMNLAFREGAKKIIEILKTV